MKNCLKFLKSYSRHAEGATAIEFSVLLIPFVMIIVGILEMAMMYTASALVETSTNIASRLIRTCQIADMPDPEQAFRDSFCDLAGVLVNCDDVAFEVIAFPDEEGFFDAGSYPPVFDADGNLVSRGFDAGGVSDVVLIRVAYLYPMLTPWIGTMLAGPGNTMLMMSTIVQKTEPCEFEG